jgi:predicted metal-binding protein
MAVSTLLVCTRCRAPGADPDAPREGAALLAALAGQPLPEGVALAGVACLSGCKRACAVALFAPGKITYLFGDLAGDAASVADLHIVAAAHRDDPLGHLPRAARPERLRAGILGRVPPLNMLPAGTGLPVVTWPA